MKTSNKQSSVRRSACTFNFEDVERAVKRWNSLGPRHWLASELRRNTLVKVQYERVSGVSVRLQKELREKAPQFTPNAYTKACLLNLDLLRELLEICPETIELVPAVAHTLTLLYRQAGRHSRKDSDATRARRILAKLIPKRPGGRIALPRFIITQVWEHCHSIAGELKTELRTYGNVDKLVASEPWLESFSLRHWKADWNETLEDLFRETPRRIGLTVAAKILGVSQDTVRRARREIHKHPPVFWADLPLSHLRPAN